MAIEYGYKPGFIEESEKRMNYPQPPKGVYVDPEDLQGMAHDLDAAIDEIIRLQEQVRALERAQEMPSDAFWGQLLYDVFLFIVAIFTILRWF